MKCFTFKVISLTEFVVLLQGAGHSLMMYFELSSSAEVVNYSCLLMKYSVLYLVLDGPLSKQSRDSYNFTNEAPNNK